MSEGSDAAVPPFRHLLRVRYGECDAQKVVFNARYGDYVSVALNEFMRAIGYGPEHPSDPEIQLVRQTTEWRASARFDEVIDISVYAVHLGNTSFTMRYEFRRNGEPQPFATSETVYVHVHPQQFTKQPLPEHLRTALARGAPGVISDHAGALRGFTGAGA